jgi:hypothetical protein
MALAGSGLVAAAAVATLAPGVAEASALDCHELERRNYRPTPQQPTAGVDQDRPRCHLPLALSEPVRFSRAVNSAGRGVVQRDNALDYTGENSAWVD